MAIEYHFRQLNIIVSKGGIYGEHLRVQTVDNIIQQINRYPRDTHLQTVLHHSQDRDLSISTNWGPKVLKIKTECASSKAGKFQKIITEGMSFPIFKQLVNF